jgi:hypothetical protein
MKATASCVPVKAFHAGLALLLGTTWSLGGLKVTSVPLESVPQAGRDAGVIAQYLGADSGGTTSLRFESGKPVDTNKFVVAGATSRVNQNRVASLDATRVRQRDRDLGQTFLTREEDSRVGAVWLRLGFSERFALSGAAGAAVALQFFEVTGDPNVNESGTPGRLGRFDRKAAPELDDYLEGEKYAPLRLIRGGRLPAKLEPGMVLKFSLTEEDQLRLEKNRQYAFLLLFTERGPNRAVALANSYFGRYTPDPARPLAGHAVRREGGSGLAEAPEFKPDLPDDLALRTAQSPGTLGFPDVCTWRDLWFTVTAAGLGERR